MLPNEPAPRRRAHPGAASIVARGRPRVVVLQAWIYQYRVPFYEALRERLDARGIDLALVHGIAEGPVAHTRDMVRVPWATFVRNRRIVVAGKELWWQPALRALRGADLVVVEQASSRLINYGLFGAQQLGRTRVALWGHGVDFRPGRLAFVGEGLKRALSRRVHWWFAYNELVADIVEGLGYPRDRITDVRNAVDTQALHRAWRALQPADVDAARRELGVGSGPVALFCGAMYPDKRLGFLVEACRVARERVPDLQLVLVGDGASADVAETAAAEHPWVHRVGQRFGDDRAPFFAMARVLLLPGAVGLAVQDGFAVEVPTISSRSGLHGPEIAYLQPDNSIVVDDDGDPRRYADALVAVLEDDALHGRLVEGCRRARERYTVEHMAERFADGIERALAAPPLRSGRVRSGRLPTGRP